MQAMKVWLTEKVPAHRKSHRDVHEKVQQLWKPDLLRPEGATRVMAKLEEDLMDESKGREGIDLQTVPGLEHCIRPRGHWIENRGEVDWQLMVQVGQEQINRN